MTMKGIETKVWKCQKEVILLIKKKKVKETNLSNTLPFNLEPPKLYRTKSPV